ncbi:MAG: GatB/YqeY domain-containing protein [Bacteroidales bacterium]|nr:GatB/YqeY domain-containing protein [Bacteroidales bacterium]
MTLEEKVNSCIKESMLARDQKRLAALRAVKSEILLLKTKEAGHIITPQEEIAVLQRLVKQRKESALMYKEQNREDLFEEETFQQKVIEEFLPEQLSEEEIKTQLQAIVTETGVTSMKDMGKVMKLAQEKFQGAADNKLVSAIVKNLLAN